MSISRRSLLMLTPLPFLAACSSNTTDSALAESAPSTPSTPSTLSAPDFVGLDPIFDSIDLAPLSDDILATMDHEASSVSELVAACSNHLHYATQGSSNASPQVLTLPVGGYDKSVSLTEATLPEIAFFDVAAVDGGTTFSMSPAVAVTSGQEKADIITRDFVSPDGSITITAQQVVFHLIASTAKVLGVES